MTDHSDLIAELRALADCDSRAGEPLGKCMRRAADKIERLFMPSPAATPVSEAEPNWLQIETALAAPENAENVKRWMAALAKPASSPAGGDVREALVEAIEFADQDFHALTPAGVAMIERWRAALSQSTSAGRVGE